MKHIFLSAAILLGATIFAVSVHAIEQSKHPVPIDGKSCATCHEKGSTDEMRAAPETYAQWDVSLHKLNGVSCITCHGEDSTFKPQSTISTCASCHSIEVDSMKSTETCGSCHQVHTFRPLKGFKSPHS